MSKRLFLALELPKACRTALAALDPGVKGLRWVPAEQLHLTMSFLGDVDEASGERLKGTLAEVWVPPFLLPVRGVGVFGGSRPSVVWAGVGKGHPHLFALHQHVQDAVLRAGVEADLKPFHPHITLGRAKDLARATLQPFLRRHADLDLGLWRVNGFVLCSSVLSASGARHTVEFRCDFERTPFNSG